MTESRGSFKFGEKPKTGQLQTLVPVVFFHLEPRRPHGFLPVNGAGMLPEILLTPISHLLTSALAFLERSVSEALLVRIFESEQLRAFSLSEQ
jgi:hypothetical protein